MPLIHLLKVASAAEREEVVKIINETTGSGKSKDISKTMIAENLGRIIALFTKYNAISESLNIARNLVEEAKSELSAFPDSTHKSALMNMAEYTLQRKK